MITGPAGKRRRTGHHQPPSPGRGDLTSGDLVHRTLQFVGTTIHFEVDDAAAAAFAPVAGFFRHVFGAGAVGRPDFSVAVRGYHPVAEVPAEVWRTPQTVLRASSAAPFNFAAHVIEDHERVRYVNRTMLLDAPRDATRDPVFRVAITPGATIQLIDFVRDLVIRHEETRGTVVLHASGVRRGDEVVAIAGVKGAGKTTTLLSLLRSRAGWEYFTGDKMFCVVTDGSIRVHPWRDYPYVGVGSLRTDPRLEKLVRDAVAPELDGWPATRKVLIEPDRFESWIGTGFSPEAGTLSAILLPAVRPDEPTRTWDVTDDNARWARLNQIVDRTVDTTFFTWQSHLVPDYAEFYRSLARMRPLLSGIRMVGLAGRLDKDLADVLPVGASR